MGVEGEDGNIQKVFKINIPRGENDEVFVDLEKVEDMVVLDGKGNEVRFGDLYKHQQTILIFTRHFLCYTSKEYVEDLALIPHKLFEDAGMHCVVIGSCTHKLIESFRTDTGFRYGIYTDPEGNIFKMLGMQMESATSGGQPSHSKHIKSSWFSGVLKSTWRAAMAQQFGGDMRQNGGTIIAGPGPVIHYSHRDRHMFNHCPINNILSAAGMPEVSFPMDQRVQII